MKYEKPNMFIVFTEDESIITTSSTPGTLIPDIDIGDGNIDGADD